MPALTISCLLFLGIFSDIAQLTFMPVNARACVVVNQWHGHVDKNNRESNPIRVATPCANDIGKDSN